jgi:hypothetical protein
METEGGAKRIFRLYTEIRLKPKHEVAQMFLLKFGFGGEVGYELI